MPFGETLCPFAFAHIGTPACAPRESITRKISHSCMAFVTATSAANAILAFRFHPLQAGFFSGRIKVVATPRPRVVDDDRLQAVKLVGADRFECRFANVVLLHPCGPTCFVGCVDAPTCIGRLAQFREELMVVHRDNSRPTHNFPRRNSVMTRAMASAILNKLGRKQQ